MKDRRTSERARKRQRQRFLLGLVSERSLRTQDELVRALRAAGLPSTQATVSRDIEELGLVKVTRGGAHVYAPAPDGGGGVDRLLRFCEDYPVDAAAAAGILVLRSLPGTANALGAAIDAARLPDIVGTLAGDDTVFIAVAREGALRAVSARLADYGIIFRRGAQK